MVTATATDTRPPAASRLLSAIVFYGLLALLPLTAAPYGTVEPWWESLFQIAVFALAALWAVEGALSGRWVVREHLVALPLLLLAALAFLQSASLPWGGPVSFDPFETRLVASRLLALGLSLLILQRYVDSDGRLRALVYALVAVGLASAIFGLVRQTAQRGEMGFVLPLLRPDTGYAQFVNRNHFAFVAEMTLGLLAGLAASRGATRERALVCLGLGLPVFAALVFANSRGGILAVLCQAAFLLLLRGTRVGKDLRGEGRDPRDEEPTLFARISRTLPFRVALSVVLLAVLVLGMIWVGGDPLAERMGTVSEEMASDGSADPTRTGRAQIWKATWEMTKEHALLGVGLGGYWVAVPRYHAGSGALVPQQAHNDYLELLASGGIAGAALLLLFAMLFAGRVRERLSGRDSFGRSAALGACVGLFGVAVHSLVDFGLHATANSLMAVGLVALATARGPIPPLSSQKTSP